MIAYATAPGQTASDLGQRAGPYASALAEAHARKTLAEIRTSPKRHAEHTKKMREYHRTLPNRELSRQRAYAKLAANPEGRERNNAKQRERYHNDLEFRARGRARAKQWRLKRTDPSRPKLGDHDGFNGEPQRGEFERACDL